MAKKWWQLASHNTRKEKTSFGLFGEKGTLKVPTGKKKREKALDWGVAKEEKRHKRKAHATGWKKRKVI